MFETMGYSPDFLLKIGQFRTLADSPQIPSNSLASMLDKSIFIAIFEASQSSFGAIFGKGTQIGRHVEQKPWAIAQAFCSKSANFGTLAKSHSEIPPNSLPSSL